MEDELTVGSVAKLVGGIIVPPSPTLSLSLSRRRFFASGGVVNDDIICVNLLLSGAAITYDYVGSCNDRLHKMSILIALLI